MTRRQLLFNLPSFGTRVTCMRVHLVTRALARAPFSSYWRDGSRQRMTRWITLTAVIFWPSGGSTWHGFALWQLDGGLAIIPLFLVKCCQCGTGASCVQLLSGCQRLCSCLRHGDQLGSFLLLFSGVCVCGGGGWWGSWWWWWWWWWCYIVPCSG